jgi:hypothetical protein
MESKRLNFIIELISISFFTTAIILLLQPWMNYLQRAGVRGFQYPWIYEFMLGSTLLFSRLSADRSRVKHILITTVFLILNIIIIYLFKWPFTLFYPLFLILLVLVYRYGSYQEKKLKLYIDIVIGFVLLSVNLFLRDTLGLEIGIYSVILFFLLSFSLVLIYNIHYNNNLDYGSFYRLLFPVAVSFLLVVTIISLLISFGLTGGLSGIIKEGLSGLYHLLTKAIFYITFPLIWLVTFIMQLIINFLSRQQPRPPAQGNGGQPPDLSRIFEGNHLPRSVEIILQILVAFFIIYYLSRHLLKRKSEEEQIDTDERESIFSKAELLDDFKRLLQSFRKPFAGRKQKRGYDHSSPLGIIREAYYKFLVYFNKEVEYQLSDTPDDYLEKIREKRREKISEKEMEDIGKLTSIYKRARYGELYSSVEAEEAGRLEELIRKRQYD